MILQAREYVGGTEERFQEKGDTGKWSKEKQRPGSGEVTGGEVYKAEIHQGPSESGGKLGAN